MKTLVKSLFALAACLLALPAMAAFNIFATVPEWGALAREIGGDKVNVFVATTALQDPHRIEARPSLLAQARRAQLLIAAGADLEIGWLPMVLREAGNPAIQPGQRAYLEAAAQVTRLDVPKVLDRAHGDVHAAGNPHVHLDPRNILKVADALVARLAELDPANAAAYRAAGQAFASRWQGHIARWEKEGASLKGVPVLVHHASFRYLSEWLGLKEIGTLEPKPGIEPSSGQLTSLLTRQQSEPARMILRAAYQQDGPSRWMAEKAGIPAVVLPYTVGGSPEAADLAGLFDDTLRRLLKGLR